MDKQLVLYKRSLLLEKVKKVHIDKYGNKFWFNRQGKTIMIQYQDSEIFYITSSTYLDVILHEHGLYKTVYVELVNIYKENELGVRIYHDCKKYVTPVEPNSLIKGSINENLIN